MVSVIPCLSFGGVVPAFVWDAALTCAEVKPKALTINAAAPK
jgi:hypothetical protein